MPVPYILGSVGGAIAKGGVGAKILGALGSVGSFLGKIAPLGGLFKRKKDGRKHNPILKAVLDAKEAGIHPLYALGSGAGISPQWDTGGSYADVGDAVARTYDRFAAESQAKRAAGMEDPLLPLQKRALMASASRDEAQAALANAQAAKARQSLNWSPVGRGGSNATWDPLLGLYETTPATIVSGRPGAPGTQAGPPAPGSQEIIWPDGSVGSIPPQQVMDSEIPGAEWYARKILHEGMSWLKGTSLGRAMSRTQRKVAARRRRAIRRLMKQGGLKELRK